MSNHTASTARHAADPTQLQGKVGLVSGVVNEYSIAYGCAEAFQQASAELSHRT